MDQIFLGNRYELHEEIGSGGMAHVFKARDTLLDRIVAIKILKPEYTEDAQFIERFRVEAKAAASLSNSNIVMIYDVGQDDGIYYIIMEYIDGITLKEYIANAGHIPWKEAVTLAIQMTQAIDSAHSNKIIHRDIKPQNVLIARDRKIKITDFGIARAASTTTITTVGNAMGSVHYFSPEQAKGSLTDEKSDIYSLGITLYEMLTGSVPFEGDTPIAVALKHIQEPPVSPSRLNPQIPQGVSAIVLKSIAKDKYDRYQSMGEMLVDLKKVMKDPSGETLQYASVYRDVQDRGAGAIAGYPGGAGANAGYPGGAGAGYPAGAGAGAGYPGGGGANAGYLGGGGASAGYPGGAGAVYPTGASASYPGGAGYIGPGPGRGGQDAQRNALAGYTGNTPANIPRNPNAGPRGANIVPRGPGAMARGPYQRDGDYRDGYYDREREAYEQDGYGDQNGGEYQEGAAVYPADGYNGAYGGEEGYSGERYPAETAAAADDIDTGYRRNGKPRRDRARDEYEDQDGGADRGGAKNRGRGGSNGRKSKSYNGGSRADRARDRDRDRDDDRDRRGGGGRGGSRGYTGVFVVVVLIATFAAIAFVVWIVNELFGAIPQPLKPVSTDEDFSVGQYLGRKYADVKDELLEAGIKSKENRVPNDDYEEGVIYNQSIQEGSKLKRNGKDVITFEVSDGANRFKVPDYRELKLDSRAAEAELRDKKLIVTVVDEKNGTVPKGNVIRTEPGAGAQLSSGEKITIYRSSGSDISQTSVPALIGKTYKEALDMLEDAKLMLGAVSPENMSSTATVTRQSLAPNAIVDEWVTIDLWFGDAGSLAENNTTAETTAETSPAETPEPSPTPTPTPEATPTPDATSETTSSSETTATTEERSTTTRRTTESRETIEKGEPVNMSIRLKLPPERTYGDTIKVLVEATPSDTGRTTRLLNRSVMKTDFPKSVDFIIPANGSVEIKVYYDGEFMQTQTFRADEY